jgi:hypothetical protein
MSIPLTCGLELPDRVRGHEVERRERFADRAASIASSHWSLETVDPEPRACQSCSNRCLWRGSRFDGSTSIISRTFCITSACCDVVRPSATLVYIWALRYSHCRCVIPRRCWINWVAHEAIVSLDPEWRRASSWRGNSVCAIRPYKKFCHPK